MEEYIRNTRKETVKRCSTRLESEEAHHGLEKPQRNIIDNPKKYPRRISEDRRDEGGGAFCATPPPMFEFFGGRGISAKTLKTHENAKKLKKM